MAFHGRAKSKKVDELKFLLYLPDLQFSLIIETKIQNFQKISRKNGQTCTANNFWTVNAFYLIFFVQSVQLGLQH